MKTFAPNYYPEFHCIADKCRHSCCVGWDIYIDSDTYELYEQEGEYFTRNIEHTPDGPRFRLDEGERCPYLRESGLCDMMIEKGEDCLCDICREHPRFYNLFSHRTEAGIGLCCEEGARLILSQEGTTRLVELYDDGTEEYTPEPWEIKALEERERVFELLQNKALSLDERIGQLGVKLPEKSLTWYKELFLKLERLDSEWGGILITLDGEVKSDVSQLDNAFEKLLLYFIYRHTAREDLTKGLGFAYLGCYIVRELCRRRENCSFDDLCDLARMYSSEIEYSEDNTNILFDII